MLKITHMIALLAISAFWLISPPAVMAGGGPEAAVDSFFGALKAGDMEAAKMVFSGPAMQNPPAEGTKQYEMMVMWGKAYQKVTDVKVNGDKATAVANLDGMPIAQAMMAQRKSMLDKIEDPAEKTKELERYKNDTEKLAMKFSKLPIQLVKQDGIWMLLEVK